MRTKRFNKNLARLDRQFERLQRMLPGWGARPIEWLRRPAAVLLRIPLGLLLIAGGVFSFLPLLGLWMLPLGLLLLAIDIPFLRGPVVLCGILLERRIDLMRRKWRDQRHARQLSRKQP